MLTGNTLKTFCYLPIAIHQRFGNNIKYKKTLGRVIATPRFLYILILNIVTLTNCAILAGDWKTIHSSTAMVS